MVAGGVESVSLVQTPESGETKKDPWLTEHCPGIWMSMLDTAEVVARRYGIDRDRQDAFAAESQQRAAAAQARGAFDDEIVAMTVEKEVIDRQSGAKSLESVTIGQDEGVRGDTTREKLAALKPVQGEGSVVTAGNACQLSDGASACVIMRLEDAREARPEAPRNLSRLRRRRLRARRDGDRTGLRRAEAAATRMG